MSLQLALLFLGLGVLALVVLFSRNRGRITVANHFQRYPRIQKLVDRLIGRVRREKDSRSAHREPSLVSVSDFYLDPLSDFTGENIVHLGQRRVLRDRSFVPEKTVFDVKFTGPLKIDYWARVPGSEPVTCHDVLSVYRHHELDMEYPHLIHGRSYPSNIWIDLEEASRVDRFTDLVVSVQMVDRRGPVTESELTRTNSLVYALAEELNRKFQFDMTVEEAIDQALRLEQFCQRHDVLVIVNLSAQEGSEFVGKDIEHIVEHSHMEIGPKGMFHLLDQNSGRSRFTMANRCEPYGFDLNTLKTFSTRGLTLFMSVPRVPNPVDVFEQMISVAQYTTSEFSGELRDPDGGLIDESGVEKIRQQLTVIGEEFYRVGIDPGSEEALRLF